MTRKWQSGADSRLWFSAETKDNAIFFKRTSRKKGVWPLGKRSDTHSHQGNHVLWEEGEEISHKDSRGSWFPETNAMCRNGIGFEEKWGMMTSIAPQEGLQAEGIKMRFLELGILLHWLNTGGVTVCPHRLIAVSILPSIWRLWKDSLCASDSLLLGFLLKGCFLWSLERKSSVGGWGKITKGSFDSAWLGTWLKHPF